MSAGVGRLMRFLAAAEELPTLLSAWAGGLLAGPSLPGRPPEAPGTARDLALASVAGASLTAAPPSPDGDEPAAEAGPAWRHGAFAVTAALAVSAWLARERLRSSWERRRPCALGGPRPAGPAPGESEPS
jgi:hypothetical protein